MATPILKPFNNNDGTFYQFSEAAKHLESTFAVDSLRFVPSMFICLKLPDYEQNATKNTLYDLRADAIPNPNIGLPRFIQNYVENMVQHLNATNNYIGFDSLIEPAFWKWLGAIGALHVSPSTETGFYDEASLNTGVEYNEIVKYVGRCEILNNVNHLNTDYTEIYLHIPTYAGKTTGIRFKETTHPSWLAQNSIVPDTYAYGLDVATTAPLGALSITDRVTTEPNEYDLTMNGIGTLSGTTHQICKTNGLNFDFSNVENGTESFDFNCVLLYYDYFDSSNQTIKGTNLYGVLFLQDFKEDGLVWRAPVFNKYSEAETTTANSFVMSINRKLNSSSLNGSPKFAINVYNSASMQNYTEALERMLALTRVYEESITEIEALKNKISNFEHFYSVLQSNIAIIERLGTLEQIVAGFGGTNTNQIKNDDLLRLFLEILKNQQNNGGNITGNFDFVFNNPLPPMTGNEGKVLYAGANETAYWAEVGRSETIYRDWFLRLVYEISLRLYVIEGNDTEKFDPDIYFATAYAGTVEDVANALNNFIPDFNSRTPISVDIDPNYVFNGSYVDVTQEQTLIDSFTRFVSRINTDIYSTEPLDLTKIIKR